MGRGKANWGQLHERLQKEGVKTHKEKVEELNKYLSNLSEHHDM
jgi:protein FAM32A